MHLCCALHTTPTRPPTSSHSAIISRFRALGLRDLGFVQGDTLQQIRVKNSNPRCATAWAPKTPVRRGETNGPWLSLSAVPQLGTQACPRDSRIFPFSPKCVTAGARWPREIPPPPPGKEHNGSGQGQVPVHALFRVATELTRARVGETRIDLGGGL